MYDGQWILNNQGEPEQCPDPVKWARWFASAKGTRERIVQQDDIGSLHVSTVFLGLDQNHTRRGKPVLWETMIFGLPGDGEYQERYTSLADAKVGHQRAVAHATSMWVQMGGVPKPIEGPSLLGVDSFAVKAYSDENYYSPLRPDDDGLTCRWESLWPDLGTARSSVLVLAWPPPSTPSSRWELGPWQPGSTSPSPVDFSPGSCCGTCGWSG